MSLTLEPCAIQKLEMAAELLKRGHRIRLRVFGASMLPSLWPGDLLTIESVNQADLQIGDLILVAGPMNVRVHRLLARQASSGSWVTRGDAMRQNDPPVFGREVLGRVVDLRRGDRTISLSGQLSGSSRILARIFCRCDFVRRIALRLYSAWSLFARESDLNAVSLAQPAPSHGD